jgi:hypothetical protein
LTKKKTQNSKLRITQSLAHNKWWEALIGDKSGDEDRAAQVEQ